MTAVEWTRERVEELARTQEHGGQRIELPFGVATAGPDFSATAKRIFPDDLSGKSVLDLNCGHGFFCFEAKRRGAARVVGIDVDPHNVRSARRLADCLGFDVEFESRDVERHPVAEKFDYVLCLAALDDLRDPILLIDRLVDIVRERLIIDLAAPDEGNRRKLGLMPVFGRVLSRSPVMYVSRDGTEADLEKFMITPGAMRNLLMQHRRFFSHLEVVRPEDTGRHLFVAQKHRIRHLIVVSGPVSAGKSTFCRKLLADEAPGVYERLGVSPENRPTGVFLPRARSSVRPESQKTLLFHYNFLNPYVSSARVHARDENLDILQTAEKLSFLTIWASPQRLERQITKSEIEGGWFHRPAKRHLMLREEYRDPRKVIAHYEAWIDYVATHKGEHLIVEQEAGAARLLTVGEWRALTAPYRGAATLTGDKGAE